jgi:UDP-N-acetylmuramoyl-tripeptide--D-alanyl-D-alanine ligase
MNLDIDKLYRKFQTCTTVSTDTRKIDAGCLFFALKGPNFNGNSFAREALEKGARFVVVDEPAFALNDEDYMLVDDSLRALQALANHHRRTLQMPVVGITGSNGKTTTKELISAVLGQKYRTYATRGNLNNHIGVPLTILSIGNDVQMAVIEMGANKIGDIRELVSICEPTHGLITNIGRAHLEGFGGIGGVKRGKGELFDFLQDHKGVVFVNSGNETLLPMARQLGKPVTYPAYGDYFQCELLEASPQVVYRDESGETVVTQLAGAHNFENIAAALCIGKYFGVPASQANEAIRNYVSANNRSQVVTKGSNTIYLDAYNANPTSMQASLEHFMTIRAAKKAVVIGDMYELGEDSAAEHRRIGEVVAKGNFDFVLLCGKYMQNAVAANPKAYYFIDKFSLNNWLTDHTFENTHILIKGSRGMSMETIVSLL